MITKICHHRHISACITGRFSARGKLLTEHRIFGSKENWRLSKVGIFWEQRTFCVKKGRLKTIYGQNIPHQILPISSKKLDSQPSLVSPWRQNRGMPILKITWSQNVQGVALQLKELWWTAWPERLKIMSAISSPSAKTTTFEGPI